jgi:hypothetical protein
VRDSIYLARERFRDTLRSLATSGTFEDVKTDTAKLVNVWMVNFGEKADLWRLHGIVFGKEELKLEDAAFVRALHRASNGHVKVTQIVVMRRSSNPRRTVLHKPFAFLQRKL